MTSHINASFGQIASLVIMPGDPLRVKVMSEKFLTNAKLVSQVRNNLIYTGHYKNMRVSIASSGIGQPSMGIYSYELYKFYNVKVIIRVGSCGVFNVKYKLWDILNVQKAFSHNLYFDDFYNQHFSSGDNFLYQTLSRVAKRSKINLIDEVNVITDKKFYFSDAKKFEMMTKIYNLDAVEMEAYALFVNANFFNAKAACLLTVSDLIDFSSQDGYTVTDKMSVEARLNSLTPMFELALETCLFLDKNKVK